MTQKAKKYHDGILRVLICRSHSNLITLLSEDGAILSSKYLKSVACLETGKNCEFPNYLVEICERRASAAGQGLFHLCAVPKKETSGLRTSNDKDSAATSILPKDHSKKVTNVCNSKIDSFRSSIAATLRDDLPKDHSKKVTNNYNSKIDSFGNSSAATLRDAWQILSVLKKPNPEGSLLVWDPFVEQGFTSQTSESCQLDLQMSSEKSGTSTLHGLKPSNSQKDSMSAAHFVLDADCEGMSSIWSSGAVALDTSPTKCIINNTGGHTGVTTKVSEVLGDPMLPGSSQTNKPDKPISDIGFSREVIHSMKPIVPSQNSLGALNGKQHFSVSASSILKDNLDANERNSLHGVDTGISSDSTPDQLCTKASQTGEICESVSFVIAASSVHATSDGTTDPVSSVELANVEDSPSFDLGL